MKRGVLLTGLAICLLAWCSAASEQSAPAEKKPAGGDFEGFWTQVHSEVDGDSSSSLGNPGGQRMGMWRGNWYDMGPFLWKFSKDEIGSGWEQPSFPLSRMQYQLNPGGKIGEINLMPLDKDGKKLATAPMKGIYFLKDDFLMICYAHDGSARPAQFTSSAKSKSVLVILSAAK